MPLQQKKMNANLLRQMILTAKFVFRSNLLWIWLNKPNVFVEKITNLQAANHSQ